MLEQINKAESRLFGTTFHFVMVAIAIVLVFNPFDVQGAWGAMLRGLAIALLFNSGQDLGQHQAFRFVRKLMSGGEG